MATIGLSMIVKNGGEDLRYCLESVRSLVHQIVIADTGSTDNTVEIATEFGATITRIPWADHYAEARNAALEKVTTDWVLSLDADEELSIEAARGIPQLIEQSGADIGGYRLPIRNYFADSLAGVSGMLSRVNNDSNPRAKNAKSYAEHMLGRLFRREPRVKFSGRIHESVELQILAAGYKCVDSNLRILHFGTLAGQESYRGKQAYYRKLLWMAVKETPHYPHLWVQLALEEAKYFENPDVALRCAEEAVTINANEYEAWSMIGAIHQGQKRYELAIKALNHLPDSGDWGITKMRSLGDLLYQLGRLHEARTMYLLAQERVEISSCAYPDALKASVESRLGYIEVQLGLCTAGFRKLHHAADISRDGMENHERLVNAYVLREDNRSAADVAESTLQYIANEKLFRRAVALRARLNEYDRAAALADAGLQMFPESIELQKMKMEIRTR
ncbi:tetratricopeptide repeat-containing glycosyltransferase family 2 protein [Tunturiibacter lichenicola]|uniref:tetratricopeptide repeat-containing glycosyltransferase family 2 protein n=1 Tax=Tunturiibacter lichenicola TaxID=2051959 RepID=UPI003D9B3398